MSKIEEFVKKVFTDEYYSVRTSTINFLKKVVLRKFLQLSDMIKSESRITMSRSYKLLQDIPVANDLFNQVEGIITQKDQNLTYHQMAELYNSAVNFLAQELSIMMQDLRLEVSRICVDPELRTYNVKVNMIQVLRYRRKEYEQVGYQVSSWYADKHRESEKKDSVDLAEEVIDDSFKS